MRILFLDDSTSRTNLFKQRSFGHTVKFAADAKTACHWLDTGVFDLILLDHDLSEETECDGSEENVNRDGRFVARHIVSLGDKHKYSDIIIHSLNPVAREEMRFILMDAGFTSVGITPFAWKTLDLKD